MKKLVFTVALLTSVSSFAVTYKTDCTTVPQGTKLNMVFDASSTDLIMSLEIASVNRLSDVRSERTSSGYPNFELVNFPQTGTSTFFNFKPYGSTYTINGKSFDLKCVTRPLAQATGSTVGF